LDALYHLQRDRESKSATTVDLSSIESKAIELPLSYRSSTKGSLAHTIKNIIKRLNEAIKERKTSLGAYTSKSVWQDIVFISGAMSVFGYNSMEHISIGVESLVTWLTSTNDSSIKSINAQESLQNLILGVHPELLDDILASISSLLPTLPTGGKGGHKLEDRLETSMKNMTGLALFYKPRSSVFSKIASDDDVQHIQSLIPKRLLQVVTFAAIVRKMWISAIPMEWGIPLPTETDLGDQFDKCISLAISL
jgi:hypothetical protein